MSSIAERSIKYQNSETECSNCHKMFNARKFHGKEQQFCSHECYCEYREKNSLRVTDTENRDLSGKHNLSPDKKHLQELVGRKLFPGEITVRIGPGPDDLRIMDKNNAGKFLHNVNSKYILIEDGNYQAHVEFNENSPVVHRCPICEELFAQSSLAREQTYCSIECVKEARRRENEGKFFSQYKGKTDTATAKKTMEHREVAQKILGRTLFPGEIVHHEDKNQLNNSEENIIIFHSQSDHAWWHRYGPEGLAKLEKLSNGTYVTRLLRKVVDIVPEEERKLPR